MTQIQNFCSENIISRFVFILNSKQAEHPGKRIGSDQMGVFHSCFIFFLLDMLKMYEIESFFYIKRGILLFLKLLGQNILLS